MHLLFVDVQRLVLVFCFFALLSNLDGLAIQITDYCITSSTHPKSTFFSKTISFLLFPSFIQPLSCLHLPDTPTLVTSTCLLPGPPCRHSARHNTWKTELCPRCYFIFSLPRFQYLFHICDNCLSRRSAPTLHNAWNPDITQYPERVLGVYTLLIYGHANTPCTTADRSAVQSHAGHLSGWT